MSHMDEIIEVQKRVIRNVAKNPKIKASLFESFESVMKDDETQALVSEIFEDVLVNNERLKLTLEKQWQSPSAKGAISLANERLEPTINEIGVLLFGSPNGEITPEFARVVRHRILHKDSRWLTIETQGEIDFNEAQPKSIVGRVFAEDSSIPYAATRGEK